MFTFVSTYGQISVSYIFLDKSEMEVHTDGDKSESTLSLPDIESENTVICHGIPDIKKDIVITKDTNSLAVAEPLAEKHMNNTTNIGESFQNSMFKHLTHFQQLQCIWGRVGVSIVLLNRTNGCNL